MKELLLDGIIAISTNEKKSNRLEQVLAENERILNKLNACLSRIDARQIDIEIKLKQLDGLIYFNEWKTEQEGVITDGRD